MDISWLFLTYAAVFGVFFGSFLHVVVYRTHKGEIWWSGRSHCFECDHQLSWIELIPLVSFALQKGKCRACKARIPLRYPLVELISGFITFGTFSLYGFTLSGAVLWVIALLLLCNFLSDLFYMELPDEFSIPTIILSVAYSYFIAGISIKSLGIAIGFGAFFFGAQYVLTKGRGLGSGDIRLGVIIGALLGWPMALISIMLAYVGGSIISLGLLAARKMSMKSALPLGVFLIPALVLCFVLYEDIMNIISQYVLINLSV